MLNKAFNLMQK